MLPTLYPFKTRGPGGNYRCGLCGAGLSGDAVGCIIQGLGFRVRVQGATEHNVIKYVLGPSSEIKPMMPVLKPKGGLRVISW